MTVVEKIKTEASKLNPDEQYELFRWWIESEGFKERQLAALKRDIAAGLEDLKHGRYKDYSDANLMELAEDVSRSGRERLAKSRANPIS